MTVSFKPHGVKGCLSAVFRKGNWYEYELRNKSDALLDCGCRYHNQQLIPALGTNGFLKDC